MHPYQSLRCSVPTASTCVEYWILAYRIILMKSVCGFIFGSSYPMMKALRVTYYEMVPKKKKIKYGIESGCKKAKKPVD